MKVWLLIFRNVDFFDCNGIYSTKQKALDGFECHCERCCDIWENPKVGKDHGTWVDLSFYYKGEKIECDVAEYEIDEIGVTR